MPRSSGTQRDAVAGDGLGRRPGDVVPVDGDVPLGQRHQSGDRREQGGLAGAVGTEHGHRLAGGDLQVHAAHGVDAAVGDHGTGDVEHGRGHHAAPR